MAGGTAAKSESAVQEPSRPGRAKKGEQAAPIKADFVLQQVKHPRIDQKTDGSDKAEKNGLPRRDHGLPAFRERWRLRRKAKRWAACRPRAKLWSPASMLLGLPDLEG
jgi:hypothetical protein